MSKGHYAPTHLALRVSYQVIITLRNVKLAFQGRWGRGDGMLAGRGLRDTEKWGDGDKASRREGEGKGLLP